ncbi:hypothetical protein HPB50_005359 [Hyalomma asiaticum]|uniref:Uncharacterized protein n=1 Tax=Hyalomma asiaticum TaxID=266040 RepID=A0ACB7SBS7_HYAAI|nr:hypothetical protein HPB50_005359 [Hyalomma asiaticum]
MLTDVANSALKQHQVLGPSRKMTRPFMTTELRKWWHTQRARAAGFQRKKKTRSHKQRLPSGVVTRPSCELPTTDVRLRKGRINSSSELETAHGTSGEKDHDGERRQLLEQRGPTTVYDDQLGQLVINYSYAYITFGDEFTNRRGERRRLQKQAASATQGNEADGDDLAVTGQDPPLPRLSDTSPISSPPSSPAPGPDGPDVPGSLSQEHSSSSQLPTTEASRYPRRERKAPQRYRDYVPRKNSHRKSSVGFKDVPQDEKPMSKEEEERYKRFMSLRKNHYQDEFRKLRNRPQPGDEEDDDHFDASETRVNIASVSQNPACWPPASGWPAHPSRLVPCGPLGSSMEYPEVAGFSNSDRFDLICTVALSLYMSGISTYILWYYTWTDPLLNACCELSDDQYRFLRGKYSNMTLLKLNQTGPLEYLPDCIVLTNSTKQLAPQRCCSERHLLSLTMPSDAFKVYERPLNCGHVACKNISNHLEMVFSVFVLFCVAHFMAYWIVRSEYIIICLTNEIRRRRAQTREGRTASEPQVAPAVIRSSAEE